MSLISVVIPVYNVSKFLPSSLDSIINQTYKQLEIILINDGSTDGSLEICKKYEQLDNRIHLISQSNQGLSAARNTGINRATGTHIFFLDSDDWLELGCIEKVFEKSADKDLVCCSYNRVFENSSIPRKLNCNGDYDASHIQRRIVGLINEELNDPSQADSLVTAWGKLYKTDIIQNNRINFTDTKLIGTEDALFNIQYLEYCKKVCVIDSPLVNYRKFNFSSLTSTYKKSLFSQWKKLYSLILEIIKHKDSAFLQAYHNRICLSIIGLGLNEMQNKEGFLTNYRNIKMLVNDDLYRTSYKTLNLKFFPIHWKFFFFFAKKRMVFPLLLMLIAIKKIIAKD